MNGMLGAVYGSNCGGNSVRTDYVQLGGVSNTSGTFAAASFTNQPVQWHAMGERHFVVLSWSRHGDAV